MEANYVGLKHTQNRFGNSQCWT